ncbi:hypothetical protein LTR09_001021 [Extremus antarcticus]|uniref:SET domain-containing protein n=1 Tax=Extremus antarcticus TaxID=702011 RepID=A0AAJ0GHY7_9PEZI|nr:hypothetical protein LTR09_001021 [Extremus antarcticus]
MFSQTKKLEVVDLTLSDDDGPAKSSGKSRRSAQAGLGASRKQSSKHGRPAPNKDNKGSSSARNGISDLGTPAEASTKGSGSKPRHVNGGETTTPSRHGAQSSSQDLKPAHPTPLKTPFDRAPRPYAQSSTENPPEKGPAAQTPSKMNEQHSRKRPLDNDGSHRDDMPAKRSKVDANSGTLNKETAEWSVYLLQRARTMTSAAQKAKSASQTIDLTSPPPAPFGGSPGAVSSELNRKATHGTSKAVSASEKGSVARGSSNGHTRPSSSLPARPKSPITSKRMATMKDQAADKIAEDRSSGVPMHLPTKPRPSLVPYSSSSVGFGSGFASNPPSPEKTTPLAAPTEGRTRSSTTAPHPASPSKVAQSGSRNAAGASTSSSNVLGVDDRLDKSRPTDSDRSNAATATEARARSGEQRRGGSPERVLAPTADGAPQTPVQQAGRAESSNHEGPVTSSSPSKSAAQHVPENTLSLAEEADLQLRTEAMGEAEPELAKPSPAFAVPTFAASATQKSIYGNLPLTSQVEKVLGKYLEEMRGDNEHWANNFLQRARLTKEDGHTQDQSIHPVSFAAMKPKKLSPQQKKSVLGEHERLWKVEKIGPTGKPLGVTPLTTRYTKFHTETRDVPNYAHYASIKHNILAPNVTNLHCWPYFSDDFEMAQAENLHDEYNLDIEVREERLLLLLQAQKYETYVESTLQDLECSWADLLRYLIEEQAKREDSWKARHPTQKQQEDEATRRKIENLWAESPRSKAILAALPQTTPEKRARVEVLCENFQKMAKFSIWHVARRSAEADSHTQAEGTKDVVTDLTCRVCLRTSCLFHGELRERPEDDSDSKGSITKHEILVIDIVNPPKANDRTRVAFPPTLPESSVSTLDFRAKTQKKSSLYWRSPQLWKELDQLEPFYPCHHPGMSGCRNGSIQRGVPKHTLLGDSGVHGLGLWACEDIREHEFVGEYKGEIITKKEADRRGAVYEHQKLSYLFTLNATQEIDSTYFGNKIRFINHASAHKANLYPRIIMVNAVHRIALYANRNIKSGEELLFDYGPKFPDEQLGGKKSKSEKSAPHVRNANLIQGFKDVEESEDAVGNLRTKAVNRLVVAKGKAKGGKGGTRARGGFSSGRGPQHANRADESLSDDHFADPAQRLQAFNTSDDGPLHDPMEMDDDDDYQDDPEEHGSSEISEESDEE